MRELRELHDSATGGTDSFTQLLAHINHCTTKTDTECSGGTISAECCPPDVRYSALHDSLSTYECHNELKGKVHLHVYLCNPLGATQLRSLSIRSH